MKILRTIETSTKHCAPGDELKVSYNGEVLVTEKFTMPMMFDTIVIVEFGAGEIPGLDGGLRAIPGMKARR
jgi:hypothetical protein